MSVPGSIRALTTRSSSSSAAAGPATPTAVSAAKPWLRTGRKGGAAPATDELDWDDSEDDVTAAYASPVVAPAKSPALHEALAELPPPALAEHSASAPVSRTATAAGSRTPPVPFVRSASQSSAPGDGGAIDSDVSLPDMSKLTTLSPSRSVPSIASLDGKRMKFRALMNAPVIDIDELRKLSWNGIPDEFRPIAWKLLMGYLPLSKERRHATLERKRLEYVDSVAQNFGAQAMALDQKIFHQIHIDVPRTNPDVKLFQHEIVQRCLERILYVWAIRHPASGYVQGINDLVTPFFIIFLSSHIPDESDPELVDPSLFSEEVLTTVEADSYWCLSKLLDGIQDNYTQSQPGIQRRVFMLKELVQRIDAPLHNHLQQLGVEFLQFSFRWMNCLLMREMSLRTTIRMWDTYMAEGVDGYANFHLYVCAAFLISWTKQLQKMDTSEEMMMFLQDLPSQKWTNKEVEILLSEAYMWKSLYQNAPSHLHANH